LVLSLRDRFAGLSGFGLLVCLAIVLSVELSLLMRNLSAIGLSDFGLVGVGKMGYAFFLLVGVLVSVLLLVGWLRTGLIWPVVVAVFPACLLAGVIIQLAAVLEKPGLGWSVWFGVGVGFCATLVFVIASVVGGMGSLAWAVKPRVVVSRFGRSLSLLVLWFGYLFVAWFWGRFGCLWMSGLHDGVVGLVMVVLVIMGGLSLCCLAFWLLVDPASCQGDAIRGLLGFFSLCWGVLVLWAVWFQLGQISGVELPASAVPVWGVMWPQVGQAVCLLLISVSLVSLTTVKGVVRTWVGLAHLVGAKPTGGSADG